MRDGSTVKFSFQEQPEWPGQAWLAQCGVSGVVIVRHGKKVECHEQWFCEAVWDGEFAHGEFDQTDIVFGSGGRIRGGEAIFVASGSTCDRLHSISSGGFSWISNSLPCLLTGIDAEVEPAFSHYPELLGSIVEGIENCATGLPTTAGLARLTYFHNLRWDGKGLHVAQKPFADRSFASYDEYLDFLRRCMKAIALNASDQRRKVPYRLLSTLSSGYDSSMVSVLAKEVGCIDAITITSSRAGTPDSGDALAATLGLDLKRVHREDWRKRHLPEALFLAADSKGPDCYFAGAEPDLAGRLVLTGFPGDHWRKNPIDISPQILRGDQAGLSLTEYRLHAGFIHCSVPYFGVRAAADLKRISNSLELKPWDVPGWSKPICRRLVEEAGVARGAFGATKQAASVLMPGTKSFLTDDSVDDFRRWIGEAKMRSFDRLLLRYRFELSVLAGKLLAGIEQSARWLMPRLRDVPVLWRLSRSRAVAGALRVRESHSRVHLRRSVFPWAVAVAQSRYRGARVTEGDAVQSSDARDAEVAGPTVVNDARRER